MNSSLNYEYTSPSPVKRETKSTPLAYDPTGDVPARHRVLLMQALFPYASYSQVHNIIDNTNSAEEAAQSGYEAINPDLFGVSYLKEQYDLANNSKAPKREREQAFAGVSEQLMERAQGLYKTGTFSNLSEMQEYDRTVRAFAVDTTAWDEKFLNASHSLEGQLTASLPLCEDMPGRKKGATSFRACTSETEKTLAEDTNESLPAPIIRWAPTALAVEQSEALQNQVEIVRAFEENCFFPNPFISSSDAEDDVDTGGGHSERGPVRRNSVGGHQADDTLNHQSDLVSSKETHEPFQSFRSSVSLDSSNKVATRKNTQQFLPQRPGKFIPTERMKTRKPLGNLIFRSRDPNFRPRDSMDTAGVHETNGASKGEEEQYVFDDPITFLNLQEDRFTQMLSLLDPYSDIFDFKCRCEVVDQVFQHCPRFVEKRNDLFRVLLNILGRELTGKTLVKEVNEQSLSLPFFGDLLLSTGPITIKKIEFLPEKSSVEFVDHGSRVKVKMVVKEIVFEQIDFVFMDEVEALKQNRLYEREQKNSVDRYGNPVFDIKESFTDGVTRGRLNLKAKKVKLEVGGGLWMFSSGKLFLVIEKCNFSIGSLSVSTDVTKLKVLFTLGHVILKAVLESK